MWILKIVACFPRTTFRDQNPLQVTCFFIGRILVCGTWEMLPGYFL